MDYAFPAGIACAIADVPRLDFYNARDRGYPAASSDQTESSYRVFGEADLIGLCVFGRLRKSGFTVKAACEIVGFVVDELQADPGLRALRVGWNYEGEKVVIVGRTRGHRPPGVLFELLLDIREVRSLVRQRALDWAMLETSAE